MIATMPWGQPMYDTRLLLLALGYRCVSGVLGSYLAPRFERYPVRGSAISMPRIILGRSMLGSSRLCSLTIEGR